MAENNDVPRRLRCEWGHCSNEAVTTRPGYHRRIKVCEDHTEKYPQEGY